MKQYTVKSNIVKEISFKKSFDEIFFSKKKDLMEIKCKIDKVSSKDWEKSKKMLNKYEYIYTSSKTNKNVCGIVPVSRSYFKIYEMIKDIITIKENGKAACIAEGPGGFIHCLNDNTNIKVHGITLISKDKSIPYWNQQIINNSKNNLFSGEDKTGNIYLLKNTEDFIRNIRGSCNLVTADGGFDYSNNYNDQENSSYKLIYSEIYINLNIQELNGSFVIKFFDIFNYKTIQLIYLLYSCYEEIILYKPTISRLSNSEKYIICKGFKGCSNKILDKLKEYYNNCEELIINVPKDFIDEIMKYNEIFVNKQIKTINEIIDNPIKDILNKPSENQLKYATDWCNKYGLPINKSCIHLK